jgi:acyl-[acyl-carrier-protein]-phospholipid O-acyltransferase/long-chain-fatty-acid--[acyl-carrier-protein] ligase
MLSHHNLLANFDALRQVFDITRDDAVLGLLPFSNAMSFAATLWLPALSGARAVYGFDRIPDGVGALIAAEHITLLPATPRVIEQLVTGATREQLTSLRFVAVGGDELPDDLAAAFREKFALDPLEGYGKPECAPIISLNVPDVAGGRDRQRGAGTTGHPLPGISVRIVDPATGETLPPLREGMLWVRGPNVMQGYANRPRETRAVLRDGWYVTGDRASVDDDGFLTVFPS